MKRGNLDLGALGEEAACLYLVRKGYSLISRNYRTPYGEIDIITKAPDKTLVFIEVKTLAAGSSGSCLIPEDNLTVAKKTKLFRICQRFANANPALIDERRGWRIDLVAIEVPQHWHELKPKVILKESYIRHYENV